MTCIHTRGGSFYHSSNSLERFAYDQLVSEIKFLMIGRVFISQKIHRDQNRVAGCVELIASRLSGGIEVPRV